MHLTPSHFRHPRPRRSACADRSCSRIAELLTQHRRAELGVRILRGKSTPAGRRDPDILLRIIPRLLQPVVRGLFLETYGVSVARCVERRRWRGLWGTRDREPLCRTAIARHFSDRPFDGGVLELEPILTRCAPFDAGDLTHKD